MRADAVSITRQFGKGGRDIKPGECLCTFGNVVGLGKNGLNQFFEQFKFKGEGLIARLGNLAFKFGQFHGRKAHGIGHGLTVNELINFHHLVGIFGRHFDEIAQNVVVFDLKIGNAGLLGIAGLKVGDQLFAFA